MRRHEVKIPDFDVHEASTWCGDYDVDKELEGEDIRGWCSAIPRLINSVATHYEVCAVWANFYGL